jgi:hypothetical protein
MRKKGMKWKDDKIWLRRWSRKIVTRKMEMRRARAKKIRSCLVMTWICSLVEVHQRFEERIVSIFIVEE